MSKELECIKALSRIEGAVMSLGGITNRAVFNDNIDIVMDYFSERVQRDTIENAMKIRILPEVYKTGGKE
jgi:hypothetical protein